MFGGDRGKRERREKCQGSDDDDHAHQQTSEQKAMSRNSAAGNVDQFLPRQAARDRERREQNQETTDQHLQSERDVVPRGIGIQAGESSSVGARRARVGVEDFTETVRAVVAESRQREARQHRRGRENQNGRARYHQRDHHQLHFFGFNLLAQIFRRPAHHKAGDEDCDQTGQDH